MVELSPVTIFFIILLAVPLQWYLSPTPTKEMNYYLFRFVSEIRRFYEYLVPENDEYSDDELYVSKIEEILDETVTEKPNSGPVEFFGGSNEPRDPRPPFVKYRVGQVVCHKLHKYRGVIVGWDETANAPEWWIKKVHKDNKHWRDMPNYVIAIDTRDRLLPQIAYVVEENVMPAKGAIYHPLIKRYFERIFPDSKAYKIKPWYQKIYPND